jgi:hypothetical protein
VGIKNSSIAAMIAEAISISRSAFMVGRSQVLPVGSRDNLRYTPRSMPWADAFDTALTLKTAATEDIEKKQKLYPDLIFRFRAKLFSAYRYDFFGANFLDTLPAFPSPTGLTPVEDFSNSASFKPQGDILFH